MPRGLLPIALGLSCVAAQPASQDLSKRILNWLPADTEAFVASSVPLSLSEAHNISSPGEIYTALTLSALPALAPDHPIAQALGKLRVRSAFYAAQTFDWYQLARGIDLSSATKRCAILSAPAAELAPLRKALRALPNDRVFERDVYLLSDARYQRGSASGYASIAFLEPGLVVFSTSRDFLDEILKRKLAAAPRAALPETLPEWRLVDRGLPVWGLRHHSRPKRDFDRMRDARGMSFSLSAASLATVGYIADDSQALDGYRRYWNEAPEVKYADLPGGALRISYNARRDKGCESCGRILIHLMGLATSE